jgi:hypothetical protein
MLRYFLRVAPEYGARQAVLSLRARKDTGCYRRLFEDLGPELPKIQQTAIDALEDPDPEVARNAVQALGRWGTPEAEAALWDRLQRLHQHWAGREAQLRSASDAAGMEQALVSAIASGGNWICGPDKLARLADLAVSNLQKQQVESWIAQWKQEKTLIHPGWFPEDDPTFMVLQYNSLTEDQLVAKLAQFPRGTMLFWQFWQPGQISPPVAMSRQEEVYERMRAVAGQHGVTLGKANHP